MRLIIICFSLFLISVYDVKGQNDTEATQLLDKFSSKALESPSVSMKFLLVTTDQMENTNDTLNGSIVIIKDRYKLVLPDNIIWFNGETSWSYLPAEKEVTITTVDKTDNSFQNHPSSIFSIYKSGFKSRVIEESASSYTIDLYPEDIESELIRIRLTVGKSLMDLKSFEYKKKDGIAITLYVTEYNLKVKPEPGTFVFQPAKYKGVEVIDMR